MPFKLPRGSCQKRARIYKIARQRVRGATPRDTKAFFYNKKNGLTCEDERVWRDSNPQPSDP